MRLAFRAVGRLQDVGPYEALGAVVHEVDSGAAAREAVRASSREGPALVLLSEEFADAAEESAGRLVFLVPPVTGSARTALERTRALITRSVGVDLVARASGG